MPVVKVTLDDMIVAEKIKGAEVGQVLSISDVLLVGGLARTLIGRPTVAGYTVKLLVEEQAKAEKILVFKKKRRKGYKRTKGYRRSITILRVIAIEKEGEAISLVDWHDPERDMY